MGRFRFPDGVDFEGRDGDQVSLAVSMPFDEDGYIGRQCCECDQLFRIQGEEFTALPDDQLFWCVYCGHDTTDPSDFLTDQQLERAKEAALGYGIQAVSEGLEQGFKRASKKSRNSSVRIDYDSKPYRPQPLPGIHEPAIILERSCGLCSLNYAVFNAHRWAPCCGPLPAAEVAAAELEASEQMLDALQELDRQHEGRLRENGTIHRSYTDTLANAVSTVEMTARRVFTEQVPDAPEHLRGKGNVFQRLEDMADLFDQHLGIDLRDTHWDETKRTWAARHLYTHADGFIDSRYLQRVPDCPQPEGKRLILTEQHARAAIQHARRLCQNLTSD